MYMWMDHIIRRGERDGDRVVRRGARRARTAAPRPRSRRCGSLRDLPRDRRGLLTKICYWTTPSRPSASTGAGPICKPTSRSGRPGPRSRAEPSRTSGAAVFEATAPGRREPPRHRRPARSSRPADALAAASRRGSIRARASSWARSWPRPLGWLVIAYLGSLALLFLNAFWTMEPFSGDDRHRADARQLPDALPSRSIGRSPAGPSAWPSS